MRAKRETIDFAAGQSFRVIRWREHPGRVESVLADGSVSEIEGEGGHWHRHAEMELTLFTAGRGTRFAGDHIGEFEAGDLVLLGGNLPHFWQVEGRSAGVSVQWHFPEGHGLGELPEMAAFPGMRRDAGYGLRISGGAAGRIGRLMRTMEGEVALVRLARLIEIFSELERAGVTEKTRLSGRPFGSAAGGRYERKIAEAVRYLIANFRGEIVMRDLLELTAMSRPTFSRQFKELAGRTVSEFVNQLRLQAVCRELEGTEKSVSEIAMGCGFGEISFFNRLFRREKGCSPREWRRGRGDDVRGDDVRGGDR